MKKFLLVLLTLTILLSAIPFSVSAEDDVWESYYDNIPWNDKNNYIDYNNENGHKTEGYRPGKITVFMTEEFMSTREAPVPADFVDYDNFIDYEYVIADIIHKDSYDYNEFDIIIEWYQELYSQPIESTISSYIIALEDFECLKIVEKVRANYVTEKEKSLSERFENYDSYYYYKNDDNHKKSGYTTDCILFNVSDEFKVYLEENFETNELGEYIIDAPIFPELQDKIVDVEIGVLGGGSVYLEKRGEENTDYSQEHIDAFVEILESVYNHPMVVFAMPNFIMTEIHPVEPDETTTDTEEVTEPVTTEQEETTAPETTAPETTVPETAGGESESTAQKNHQTGDELYFLMAPAVLAFAVVTFITTIKKRAKNR